jgi:hypothetical protein
LTRGVAKNIGEESIINGYVYVKLGEDDWRPKARLLIEDHLGRPLTNEEFIRFADKNPLNLDLSNLEVRTKKNPLDVQIRKLEERIAKLQDELEALKARKAAT